MHNKTLKKRRSDNAKKGTHHKHKVKSNKSRKYISVYGLSPEGIFRKFGEIFF